MLQYRLIIFKIQFKKTETLIKACAAADVSFYLFQLQQYCTTGWIFARRKPCFSVIAAPPGI